MPRRTCTSSQRESRFSAHASRQVHDSLPQQRHQLTHHTHTPSRGARRSLNSARWCRRLCVDNGGLSGGETKGSVRLQSDRRTKATQGDVNESGFVDEKQRHDFLPIRLL